MLFGIILKNLMKCPNVPSEIKEKYSPNSENKEQEISNNNSSIEKKKTDIKIARAFYANGIPLAVVKNPFFIQALHQINPKYNPPSRKVLSISLFEKKKNKILFTKNSKIIFLSNNFNLFFFKKKNF